MKLNFRRRKEIIEIRAEVNEIDNKQTNKKKFNETKSWFFQKISKINKYLPRLTKKKQRA